MRSTSSRPPTAIRSCCCASCPTVRRPRADVARVVAVVALLAALAPGSAQVGDSVTFAVFGDNRGGADGRQPAAFPRLVQRMAALDIEFVLGTGDYIHGAPTREALKYQWNEFFAAMAPLQARGPVYFAPAPGNHDYAGDGGRELFVEYFKRTYFSFNRGGSHFVVLDSEVPGQESRIAEEQRVWLKGDLAASQSAYRIFVAVHRPMYPVGPHKGDSLDKYPAERDGLHSVFVRNHVAAVFQGHDHLYYRETRDGVVYITTGGGGAPVYASPDKGGFYHFLYVRADRLGYNIEVVRVG